MILIVESGATKSDWRAVSLGKDPVCVKVAGMNLSSMPESAVKAIVDEAMGEFALRGGLDNVTEVHFYAAGLIVAAGEKVPMLAKGLDKVLRSIFPEAEMEYASDMMDAARAVCGRDPGITAILGTGSNSCLYDGEKIIKSVRPGGFILGDEGGATRLGKLFISDFIKGLVPEPVAGEFAADFEVDYLTVIKNVYKGDAPAGYLGGFAPWIMERYDSCDYIKALVEGNLRDFIERSLMRYDLSTYPVGVTGGYGYAYRDILKKVAEPYGVKFGKFVKSPIEGLVDYHLGRI